MPDFGSILLASALSGLCLTFTLASIWFSARSANYVRTMGLGILILVLHIVAFWQYGRNPGPVLAQVTLGLLTLGFLIIYGSANEYLSIERNRPVLAISVASILTAAALASLGYDGGAFVVAYLTVSGLLAMTAMAFWRSGDSDHRTLIAVSLLCGSCGISFALCAGVLVWEGQWVLGRAPDNWAEQLNSVLAVICMTALGALTMSLHHLRTHNALVADTMTDPLTGLLNRRALDELYGNRPLWDKTAVIIFDLDHFKKTNDVFGHPVGDLVIRRFSDVLRRHAKHGIEAFRLGGEEFAVVVEGTDPARAMALAQRIATIFGAEVVGTALGPMRSTVSGGVAMGASFGLPIQSVIERADQALYDAKHAGRNRVMLSHTARAGDFADPERFSLRRA